MENQKIDNLLNLSMDATTEEREKSTVLEEGYDPVSREWDVIIKYTGNLEPVRQLASRVTELLNGYAIVTIKEELIDAMADLTEVEFVEKPKRLYFQVENGKRVSCINEVRNGRFNLSGSGVYVAVIDSGIDYTLPEFRNEDGSTRIRSLYDQTLEKEYTMEQINDALSIENDTERRNALPSSDISGHGTAVAGIAAGRNHMTGFQGVAPQSELIVVKMGTSRIDGFPRTTELMAGVDYAVRKALEANKPMAINISFGNSYGA
ncbi:MAG: S8 family serine peptidase, partial [Eubacteriales bacterium]|nr:S8 family serine peptidase [Eubacteriales bacterium]